MKNQIVIANTLNDVSEMHHKGFITHAFCYCGQCQCELDGRRLLISENDCLIIPHQQPHFIVKSRSSDLSIDVIYVKAEFTQIATPQSNYGVRGHLMLYENPIIHLDENQRKVCALNFDYIKHRLSLEEHHFHRDAMINAVQCMIIDFFDFHAKNSGDIPPISNQNTQLMQQFISLLECGDYRQHREVGYYADKLCVTPKYLSEVCNRASGQTAIYWITRYTAHEIAHLLRTTQMTMEQLSDHFGFANTNYFVRYVQKNLGATPSSFRE